MSIPRPPSDGPTPENMVSYSEQLLSFSIARLTRLLDGHDEITTQTGKELAEEFRSLRKALEIAYHERANIQKLKGVGAVGGAALDLDAARDEIARRLDRLREASGAGALSGGAE